MDVKAVLRQYLAEHHPAFSRAGGVADETPLLSYGILDSIAMVQLITFLEERFGFEFTPKELDRRRLETIDEIARLIRTKLDHAAGDLPVPRPPGTGLE